MGIKNENTNLDFMNSLLRSQINQLASVLSNLEESDSTSDHIPDNIKRVEKNLRWFRKFYHNNFVDN